MVSTIIRDCVNELLVIYIYCTKLYSNNNLIRDLWTSSKIFKRSRIYYRNHKKQRMILLIEYNKRNVQKKCWNTITEKKSNCDMKISWIRNLESYLN